MRPFSALFALALSLFISCKQQYRTIDVHETDFQNKSELLIKGVPVKTDLPLYIYGMICCDSLNIVMAQDDRGYVFVYSSDWELLDVFSGKGRARYEFIERPRLISNQVLKGDDGHLLLPLQDQECIKVLDITESLRTHKATISHIRDFNPIDVTEFESSVTGRKSMIVLGFGYLLLDNDINHTLEVTHGFTIQDVEGTAQYRIRHDSTFIDKPWMLTSMEKIAGPQPDDKFWRPFFKHPQRNLIIEPFEYLNYIMFYDLDNDNAFAIHQSGSLTFDDDLPQPREYEDEEGFIHAANETDRCFENVAVADSCFITIYLNGEYSLSDENWEYPRPEVVIFDWEGNFINSAKLDTFIDCVAFDQKKKILYGVPHSDDVEIILSYDLSPLF